MQNPDNQQESFLKVDNVSFSVGEKKLVEQLSFSIPAHNKVALVGFNGAGKINLNPSAGW